MGCIIVRKFSFFLFLVLMLLVLLCFILGGLEVVGFFVVSRCNLIVVDICVLFFFSDVFCNIVGCYNYSNIIFDCRIMGLVW